MAELKTKENNASVAAFLDAIPDAQRREDALTVAAMMKAATRRAEDVGHPSSASARSTTGTRQGARGLAKNRVFPSERQPHALHHERLRAAPELMARLGKYKTGKSCLYIDSLADVDAKVLKQLITRALKTPLPGASDAGPGRPRGENVYFQGAMS